jgi:hypothetical protein
VEIGLIKTNLLSLTPTLSKIAESCIIEQEIRPALLKAMDRKRFYFVPNSYTTLNLQQERRARSNLSGMTWRPCCQKRRLTPGDFTHQRERLNCTLMS